MTEMAIKTCPACGGTDVKVTDSRPTNGPLRRRRECGGCGKRWTTYEISADAYENTMRNMGRTVSIISGKCTRLLEEIERLTQDIAAEAR
jgi:transcriptional regulator NrdR family protein